MHCHTALRDEFHFVFEAFRISTGKEEEKSSGELHGENSTPTVRDFYSFG